MPVADLASQGGEAALWRHWRATQDPAARETLVQLHLPFARMMAAQTYGQRKHDEVGFDDYFQLAAMGLLDAIERYDPEQGALFRTFATKRVRGAILNGLERQTEKSQQIAVSKRLRQERLQQIKADAARASDFTATESVDGGPGSEGPGAEAAPLAADKTPATTLFRYLAEVGIGLALGILLEDTGMVNTDTLDQVAEVPGPEISYFHRTELEALQQRVREAVAELKPQQQQVVRYHYLQEISFEDIARMMDVTRGRISQLHRQALLHLREHLRSPPSCDVSL